MESLDGQEARGAVGWATKSHCEKIGYKARTGMSVDIRPYKQRWYSVEELKAKQG